MTEQLSHTGSRPAASSRLRMRGPGAASPAHGGRRQPAAAASLGALGLVPFIACAAGALLLEDPDREVATSVLASYAAVILAFLGAIHWGLAMRPGALAAWPAMAASVVPALLAFAALAMPPLPALAFLGAGFVGVWAMDMHAVARGVAPPWYRGLRNTLTVAVLACIATAVAASTLR